MMQTQLRWGDGSSRFVIHHNLSKALQCDTSPAAKSAIHMGNAVAASPGHCHGLMLHDKFEWSKGSFSASELSFADKDDGSLCSEAPDSGNDHAIPEAQNFGGEVLHVSRAEELDPHQVISFWCELGHLMTPSSLGIVVCSEPSDAEITVCCSDRPPEGPLDYRWKEMVTGTGQKFAMQFGELCGVMYFAALSPTALSSLTVTLRHKIPVALCNDLLQPWKMAEAYSGSAEDDADLRRWFDENSIISCMADEEGLTPLIRACRCPWKGNMRTVRLLTQEFRHYNDVNERDPLGRTALHHLANIGNPLAPGAWPTAYKRACDLAEHLVTSCKPDLDSQDNDGNTPLHLAVVTDITGCRMLKLLLDAGCDPTIRNKSGMTPIELADATGRQHNVTCLTFFTRLPPLPKPNSIVLKHPVNSGSLLPPSDTITLATLGNYENIAQLAESQVYVVRIFDSLDTGRRGWVSRDAFVEWAADNEFGPPRDVWPAVISTCLNGFYVMGPGKLTCQELGIVLSQLAESLRD